MYRSRLGLNERAFRISVCTSAGRRSLAGRIEAVNTTGSLHGDHTIRCRLVEVNAQKLKAEFLKVLLICGWRID